MTLGSVKLLMDPSAETRQGPRVRRPVTPLRAMNQIHSSMFSRVQSLRSIQIHASAERRDETLRIGIRLFFGLPESPEKVIVVDLVEIIRAESTPIYGRLHFIRPSIQNVPNFL